MMAATATDGQSDALPAAPLCSKLRHRDTLCVAVRRDDEQGVHTVTSTTNGGIASRDPWHARKCGVEEGEPLSDRRPPQLPHALRDHRVRSRMRTLAPRHLRNGRRRGHPRADDGRPPTPSELPRLPSNPRHPPRLTAPLGAILPVPLALATLEAGYDVSNSLMRLYEMVVAGIDERYTPASQIQAVIETTTAGKAAAIAGAATAVAGGGYATIERSIPSVGRPPAKVQQSIEQGPAVGHEGA